MWLLLYYGSMLVLVEVHERSRTTRSLGSDEALKQDVHKKNEHSFKLYVDWKKLGRAGNSTQARSN